jgi:membrane-bound lytic murein transglycosylase B
VALEYAQEAQAKTGVAPAFLLAIITQESNLGTDTGSCYLTDLNTGSGISSTSGRSYSKVMHPTRDIPPFLDITKSLGLDPYKTLVSCPIGGSGYGGAMGPAQFIASTWVGIKSRLSGLLGVSNPDPWNPKDALMASALFLADLGANSNSYTSEIKAACKYYGTGGSSCAYGRNVMSRVSKIQNNIDLLSQ